MHEFKINDYVKWEQDNTSLIGKIISVNKNTVNVLIDYDWVERVPFSKLKYLPPIKLSGDDYCNIVKLEKDIQLIVVDYLQLLTTKST